MVVQTKTGKPEVIVASLPKEERAVVMAARRLYAEAGQFKIGELAYAVTGESGIGAINPVRTTIKGLIKKGAWIYNEDGGLLPASKMPCQLVYPGEGTGTGKRAGKDSPEFVAQAVRDFVHGINSAWKELPECPAKTAVAPGVIALTELAMTV
jgi:hypothetical protein